MCFVRKDKWPEKFEPTKQYLLIVSGLTSMLKLYSYSKANFVYIPEAKDKWKNPIEFLNDGGGDCEDWAIWYVDILGRIQKRDDARFIVHSGYDKERWGNRKMHHAITVLPYQGKLAVFNVDQFRTGYKDFMATGYITFPDGITRMEVRDAWGNILEKKRKWIGTF